MTYEESWPDRATYKQVVRELHYHSMDLNDFIRELGEHPDYDSVAVLAWMGY